MCRLLTVVAGITANHKIFLCFTFANYISILLKKNECQVINNTLILLLAIQGVNAMPTVTVPVEAQIAQFL